MGEGRNMNKAIFWTGAAIVCSLLAIGTAAAKPLPAYVSAALNDPGRTDADRAQDADRKPGEMVVFAGIKPGAKVVDLIPGGGYFTRIFAKAVGDKGFVYAFVPSNLDEFLKKRLSVTEITPAFLAFPYKAYANVSVLHAPVEKLAAPELVDVVWTSRNYHDMHDSFFGPADLKAVNKAIYDSLKPGGVFVVLDHAAQPGSGLRDTETLHRIDEAAVKQEVQAAGFKLIGESKILRNPNDDHTAKVFDASVKGKTDQFILKFRKPAH
jgi:predicted methyltransferase